jgi:hypothetical protein
MVFGSMVLGNASVMPSSMSNLANWPLGKVLTCAICFPIAGRYGPLKSARCGAVFPFLFGGAWAQIDGRHVPHVVALAAQVPGQAEL